MSNDTTKLGIYPACHGQYTVSYVAAGKQCNEEVMYDSFKHNDLRFKQ